MSSPRLKVLATAFAGAIALAGCAQEGKLVQTPLPTNAIATTLSGLVFSGTLGVINIANVGGSTITIDGGSGIGVNLAGVSSGTVNIASAAGSASMGNTSDWNNSAIFLNGNTGGTLNYGGSIKESDGSVLSVTSGDVATANLSGAITSTTGGTAKNEPTIARHCTNAEDSRKSTV